MQSRYQRKIAPSLLRELTRLKSGTAPEHQRYVNALAAMNKVMSDPLNVEFRKVLPDNYKAVDVLQQYRLFFKIIQPLKPDDAAFVYFVWINSEDSLHRSGESDDCYAVFSKMVEQNRLDPFTPDPVPSAEGFKRYEEWGSEYVYVNYWCRLQNEDERASSHLVLNQITPNDYLLQDITVSRESAGLAQGLLKFLCNDLDRYKIAITYELTGAATHAPKSRHILEKFGFKLEGVVDGMEIWTRTSGS